MQLRVAFRNSYRTSSVWLVSIDWGRTAKILETQRIINLCHLDMTNDLMNHANLRAGLPTQGKLDRKCDILNGGWSICYHATFCK